MAKKTLADVAPPSNLEAEQSLLGALMISKYAYWETCDLITASDFYRDAHQVIFTAINRLYQAKAQVDIVSVQEELRKRGEFEEAGGLEYLMALIDSVPSAANARYYGETVKEKSVRRQLLDLSLRVQGMARDEGQALAEILSSVSIGVLEVLRDGTTARWTDYETLLRRAYERVEEAYLSGQLLVGLPSGIPDLDELTCGFMPTDLIIVASRTSIGKTAIAQQIAEHVASLGTPVAFFSLEMGEDPLALRALQAAADVPGILLRRPRFGEEIWGKLVKGHSKICNLPIYVNDRSGLTIGEITAQAQRIVMEKKVGLILVDYIGIVKGELPEHRVRELGIIAGGLKEIAKQLKIPVIALSQLSRQVDKEKRKPMLSDIRDSGEIEQIADVVILIHRPGESTTAELIVAKNRNLLTGTVEVFWHGNAMRFKPLAKGKGKDREEDQGHQTHWTPYAD